MALRIVLAIVLAAFAFITAAKAHGRQVRLERERAGFNSVTFGGENPAFVEALWRRDRLRFWPVAVLVAIAVVALSLWRGAPPLGAALPLAMWSGMVAAFLISSVLSAIAFNAMPEVAEPGWLRAAWRGSAAWWVAALLLTSATAALVAPFFATPSFAGPAQ